MFIAFLLSSSAKNLEGRYTFTPPPGASMTETNVQIFSESNINEKGFFICVYFAGQPIGRRRQKVPPEVAGLNHLDLAGVARQDVDLPHSNDLRHVQPPGKCLPSS